MGQIVLLDELTINQIAAGEVIERPASVVKEMVENSIDAGATNIGIDVKNGGISSIRITDNGKGIAPDDMEIAFERHATSKIRSAEDLSNIKSMGFRGEALASIAAIANVEMISRTADTEFGYKVVVEAGKIIEKEETGAAIGTTITVKNLFFNTPVRYKFLKKDFTESGYIEDIVTRLALINPNISFTLTNNDKTILQTNGDGNIKNCIYSIYGKKIANAIVDVDYEYEGIKVSGVAGRPEISRNNRSNQIFFVNKRYVKDKTLSAAIEQGYKGLLTIGKHAFCIINIDLNSNDVDVNVHPAKLEVRFKEENKVFKAIYHAVRESLLNSDLIVNANDKEKSNILDNIESIVEKPTIMDGQDENKSKFANLFRRKQQNFNFNKEEVTERMNLVEELYKKKQNSMIENENILNNQEEMEKDNIDNTENAEKINEQGNNNTATNLIEAEQNPNDEEVTLKFEEMYEKTFGTRPTEHFAKNDEKNNNENEEQKENVVKEGTENYHVDVVEESENNENVVREEKDEGKEGAVILNRESNIEQKQEQQPTNISIFENEENYIEPVKYKIIGILFTTYIVLEVDNEMYMIDQHAAHEKVLYEKIKKNFYNNQEKDSQLMLLPDIITLTHKEMEIVMVNKEMFEKAGFTLEEFGDNTIKLTGVPEICMDLDTKELFMNILDEIGTLSVTNKQALEDKFIATIACKSAVKANMPLSHQEVESLMDELFKLENPFNCPHGRPTTIRMTKTDIEKKFKRIQ